MRIPNKTKIWLLCICMSLLFVNAVSAQDEALLSLRMENTELQTGETYTVSIELDNPINVWAVGFEVIYDPAQLYIFGTESGSPVTAGELLDEGGPISLTNVVDDANGTIAYNRLLVAPAEPVNERGVIGTFEIFPLQAGTTQLSFQDVELVRLERSADEGSSSTITEMPFVILPLEVNISGENATPPPEVTATPTMIPTFEPNLQADDLTEEPGPATATPIPVVTLTPTSAEPAATLAPLQDLPEDSDQTPLLVIAGGIIAIAVIGLAVMFVLFRRRS